jgi:FAD/FMN-containing dehydrogenase
LSVDSDDIDGCLRVPELTAGWSRLKISVPVASLAAMLEHVLAQTRLVWNTGYGLHSHAGSGIVYLDVDGEPEQQAGAIRTLREKAEQLGGSLVVQGAPVAVKRLVGDVWGTAGDALPLMQRVKERFDSRRTMNPGRFVGGI